MCYTRKTVNWRKGFHITHVRRVLAQMYLIRRFHRLADKELRRVLFYRLQFYIVIIYIYYFIELSFYFHRNYYYLHHGERT